MRRTRKVVVYSDEGVDRRALAQTLQTLDSLLHEHRLAVVTLSSEQLLSQLRASDAALDIALLVMPGGADRFYHRKLAVESRDGCALIRQYVRSGGAYLGLCAGAYFGSAWLEFAAQSEQIRGRRQLAFADGLICCGPAAAHFFADDTARSARLLACQWNGRTLHCYYNGGGHFFSLGARCSCLATLLRYPGATRKACLCQQPAHSLSAVIHIPFGRGNVVLSALHPEFLTPCLLDPCLSAPLTSLLFHPRNLRNLRSFFRHLLFDRLRILDYHSAISSASSSTSLIHSKL